MAYCGKCGSHIESGVKFCTSCGASNEVSADNINTDYNRQNNSDNLTDKISALNNTADTTLNYDSKDIEDNKLMAILAYLSWLVFIPILAAPKSKFARYHSNQGLVLLIVQVIWVIVQSIVSSILYSISWRLGTLASILGIVNFVFFILAIVGIINVANGKAKELPIIGKYKILK